MKVLRGQPHPPAARLLALLFLLLVANCGGPEADLPLRLLVITLDTLRADHLEPYGYERATSPTLASFSRQATLFEDVTCSMPTTLPSHLTIFSGLSPAQHGVTENGIVSTTDLVSIFELAEQKGAKSAGVVASSVLKAKYLWALGLDDIFYGDREQATDYQLGAESVTKKAIEWLSNIGAQPYVLWLHYYDTHEPYDPPASFATQFDTGYTGVLGDSLTVDFLVGLNQPENAAQTSRQDRRHIADLYDAEIAFLDAQLGRLFEFMKRSSLWEETTVLVVADHGQALGEGGFWGHGERLLEPVIKVPMMLKLPFQEDARVVSEPVETIDIVPTLAEIFDLEVPAECSGRSLLTALEGGALEKQRLRIVERRSYGQTRELFRGVIHGGRWKLTLYDEDERQRYHLGRITGSGGLDGEDFFESLPETSPLVDILLQTREAGRPSFTPPSPESVKMLRALGYLD